MQELERMTQRHFRILLAVLVGVLLVQTIGFTTNRIDINRLQHSVHGSAPE